MTEDSPDWSAKLSAWRLSGKSGAAWCRDNGIGYYQLQFVPLSVASTPLRIECNGVYMHVSSGFNPVLLREVVSALRES